MPVYSTRMFLALLSLSIIIGITGAALAPQAVSHYFPPPPKIDQLLTHTIWYLPSSGGLLDSMTSRMRGLGITVTSLDPSKLTSNETLQQMNSSSLVMMDGTWIGARTSDNSTLTFLRTAYLKGASLVAVGGPTSTFLDALKNAGVYSYVAGRNPAYMDPPLVGYRLKTASGFNPPYPSILMSNTTDPDTLIDAVNSWLQPL